ncbi:hypothetical protein O181_028407 [Austropuccinia psidii MF-1]|uniref:Uncharacterized protein n=1 Tax=Austropuccinia psidii MF-1 TaxID=1389203 RepID=A0A9Q3CRU4_9BASI|nr:hypothetical protein [Austropuccinia psidii MF-1]
MKTTPEKMAEVAKKKNSYHNFGSTDHYANSFPKEKKEIYAIQKAPEEEIQEEGFEYGSMGDAIKENSGDHQYPIEQFSIE